MAALAEHTRTIHIDAPAEKVFGYVEDPAHYLGAYPEKYQNTLEAVNRNPDGTVASYEAKRHQLGMNLSATYTRLEYVPNERIVDHSSLGIDFTLAVQPDATGTALTVGWEISRLMDTLDKVMVHSAKNVESALVKIKQEVEGLS